MAELNLDYKCVTPECPCVMQEGAVKLPSLNVMSRELGAPVMADDLGLFSTCPTCVRDGEKIVAAMKQKIGFMTFAEARNQIWKREMQIVEDEEKARVAKLRAIHFSKFMDESSPASETPREERKGPSVGTGRMANALATAQQRSNGKHGRPAVA